MILRRAPKPIGARVCVGHNLTEVIHQMQADKAFLVAWFRRMLRV
ncbi:hypothetical protein Z948_2305 [Sulfitobacter donghicola DSW-25 = KCTC 12864 = JCM 14565]|nr:hypothetical protein Z948_2305 [Sulfitobacter donghicola DSW-25 = KCTC 12864 = JCM 14565]